MKKLITFFILFFVFSVQSVSAHLPGQPPFFKIDGKYSGLYPVLSSSLMDFELPQDIGPDSYLVNEPIQFEIDVKNLPVPQSVIQQTVFSWDFGDGTKADGLKNTHTYHKIGSYVMTVNAKTPDMPSPQMIQSTLLNIIPDKNYKLPQAIIYANGKRSKDPLTDVFRINLKGQIYLDGSSSVAPSSKIISYYWDVGDETSSTQQSFFHTYPSKFQIVFPLLRIKDANGFISDTFVEIDNASDLPIKSYSAGTTLQKKNTFPLLITILFAGSIIVVIFGIWFSTRRQK